MSKQKKLLKGKGCIPNFESPCCKAQLDYDRDEYPSDMALIKFYRCDKCGKVFTELYVCKDWEEMEQDE